MWGATLRTVVLARSGRWPLDEHLRSNGGNASTWRSLSHSFDKWATAGRVEATGEIEEPRVGVAFVGWRSACSEWAPDPSNPRVLILKQGCDQTTLSLIGVICSFERDDARPRLDSDQPTLSLICPFNQGPRSFEPEGANPGDGDLSIRTRWAPDPSNPRVLILEMVICPFERDGAKSKKRFYSP
ncbi:hypothetical protein V6N13_040681 [Hibiscus sabdariffa]